MINGNRTKSIRGRSQRDFYETPLELAEVAMNDFSFDEGLDVLSSKFNILDAGCGTGVWGIALSRIFLRFFLVGIDIEPGISPGMLYDVVHSGDYLDYHSNALYDLVVGNPPYSLAEQFIRHSLELVVDGGYVFFLLRLSFLEGITRGRNLFSKFPPKMVYVCSRRPSFFSTKKGSHTVDTLAYSLFLWQKGWTGTTKLSWLDWEYK